MKTVSILFAGNDSYHMFDEVFGGFSAFGLAVSWAKSVPQTTGTVVFASPQNRNIDKIKKTDGIEIIEKESWEVKTLFEEISKICRKKDAVAVYAFADCPFLSVSLTQELVQIHEKYVAEYTFADGYPYGFAPEIIDGGTAGIVSAICENSQKKLGDEAVKRDSIFTALKTDINSFEIETVLAPEDWRLYRLSFACDTRRGLLASVALFEDAQKNFGGSSGSSGSCSSDISCAFGKAVAEISPADLARLAVKNERVLKTVPAFYNVQISEQVFTDATYLPYSDFLKKSGGAAGQDAFMPLEKFSALVDEISDFSEKAVVSLSCWGEPLLHPQLTDFVKAVTAKDGLSVLLETDGHLVTEELCQKIKSFYNGKTTSGHGKIIWIVTLDAFTEETYKQLRVGKDSPLLKACDSVALLAKYFPDDVYPQMTRLDTNEKELERFYRFWSDKNSPSGGKVIIQKYDSFCGTLPDRKPADLSPLGRNPCWHLRRDMNILCDGSVPRCHEFYSTNIVGNVFSESVEQVWAKMNLMEIGECKNCDEYYTYNF